MTKWLLAAVFVTVIVSVYLFTPVRNYLSAEGLAALQVWIEAKGVWAPLVFGLIYAGAVIFALPGSILTIAGGLLFGPLWGTLLNLTAATAGATGAFVIARYLGREKIARRLAGRLAHYDDKIAAHGLYAVIYLRLIPLVPFNLLNYSFGLTQVRFRHYVLGSLIGMAPACFAYTSLGNAGRYVRWTDPQTWQDYRVWSPLLLILVLTLTTQLVNAKRKRKKAPATSQV